MNLPSADEVATLLQPILEEENLTDFKLEVTGGSQKGDGYLSHIVQVDVKGQNRSFILKYGPDQNNSLLLDHMFHVESHFYIKIVPAFNKFLKNRFDLVPKCYKSRVDQKFLIFENLKTRGYKMWNSKVQMNEGLVLMVLKNYGKFHAISAAMRQLDPEGFSALTDQKGNFSMEDVDVEFFKIFHVNVDKMKSLFNPGTDHYKTAARLKDNIEEYLGRLKDVKGKCPVISHGDSWCNNMMFKGFEEVIFYDFQMCCFTSPAMDFCYFFYSTADENMLDHHEVYLKAYHDSFAEYLRTFELDVEEIYSLEELREEWRFFAVAGCLLATVVFKAMLQEVGQDEDVGQGAEVFGQFSKDLGSEVEDQKLRNLVVHLHKNCLI